LEGQYFDLRDYLSQIENLSWTFFWQRFDYQLGEYPVGQLSIEIYSLSTTSDFVGV
jgi:MSHA biogenesis protein MshJ